jgi:hypothetical protein
MNPRSSTTAADRHAYIPPQAETAINQHLQQNLPAHLKPFMDSSRTGYVPPQVQAEISKSLGTMPAHLQQYAGAYVQQRVAEPMGMRPTTNTTSSGPAPHPPVPDRLRLDHSIAGSGQHTVQTENLLTTNSLFQPDNVPTQPSVAAPPGPPQPPDYGFITNPPAASKRSLLKLPGGSLPKRLLFAIGGLLILVILFSIIKSVIGGSTDFTPFIAVAQDQQELIHLSTNAAQQQSTDTTTQNSAITAQLSLTSAQTQLLAYLKGNHQGVSAKVLNADVSTSLDSQLTTAAGNSTYDQTFQQIMQNQLTSYEQALSHAYNGAGPNGKKLLHNDYVGAQLLAKQLSSPAS